MKQAEQKKVLTDFRSGAFNTLVATCIGEEGLDIPQVCYTPSWTTWQYCSNGLGLLWQDCSNRLGFLMDNLVGLQQ